jgi:hypothetical protein
MRIKRFVIALMAFCVIAPVSLSGCEDRTETDETVIDRNNPAPVVVPDNKSDVDVNVHSDNPAPNVIHEDTSSNTTVEKDNDSGVTTQTQSKSTTVH